MLLMFSPASDMVSNDFSSSDNLLAASALLSINVSWLADEIKTGPFSGYTEATLTDMMGDLDITAPFFTIMPSTKFLIYYDCEELGLVILSFHYDKIYAPYSVVAR